MKKTLLGTAGPLALALVATTFPARAQVQSSAASHPDGTAESARQAYIYGYPLVMMAITKRVMTNVPAPTANGHAPANQFGSLLAFPTAAFRDVVAPNVNTLYTSGWLDLSKEPMIIDTPDTKGRYFVMETLDMWTNVIATPGSRTTGTKEPNIGIAGPRWRGTMPAGITHTYVAPTNEVWIINRILAEGPKDYPVVNALQRAMTITPLSMFGKPYTPPPGPSNRTSKQDAAREAGQRAAGRAVFHDSRARVDAESACIRRHDDHQAHGGVRRGRRAGVQDAHERGDGEGDPRRRKMGLTSIKEHSKKMGAVKNNWQSLNMCGNYGTDYLTRAAVA